MRDVVIIGGGVSGLAAAVELESHNIPYQLIEVKPRLGGSMGSVRVNSFILDNGPMWHPLADAADFCAYLESLGLEDATISRADDAIAFKQGSGALIDALAAKITAPVMHRMAVSTLGRFDDRRRFSICMENGMLLDAQALVVAAPARHAERMFHTLTPEISFRLLDYRYDTITRVSAGYCEAGQFSTEVPEDYPVTQVQSLQHPQRGPEGGVILQAGVRMSPHDLPVDVVGQVAGLMGWPLNPDADHITTWAESDPVMWRDPKHPDNMRAIGHLLPQGVALAGSDYIATSQPPRLDERIQQGIHAARRILAWLRP